MSASELMVIMLCILFPPLAALMLVIAILGAIAER